MAEPQMIRDGLRLLIAPNPGPMTHTGTNTYLLGQHEIAVIDPGPDDPAHLNALLSAIPPHGRVTHILVTHAHRDHSGLAPALAQATGAAVCAFGDAYAGRSAAMVARAGLLPLGGGEGVDTGFCPDQILSHNASLETADWQLTALHTPGHMANHLSFVWGAGDAVFVGDTVMSWSSCIISPPDGDLGDYLRSLDLLEALPQKTFLPGHGPVVDDGVRLIGQQRAHRLSRTRQIMTALGAAPASPAELTQMLYADVPVTLHPAALRNVLAHLFDLQDRAQIRAMDHDNPLTTKYTRKTDE